MGLLRLDIRNVRCIGAASLELARGRNYLIGPNGAGKTSVLEAVHLLGRGRSFRTRQTRGLVRRGEPGLSVFGEVEPQPGIGRGAVNRLGIALDERGIQGRIDHGPAESLAELARLFPVHVIDPKLHMLIEAGPSERRRFVDGGVFHVEQSYLAAWRDYRRLLSQRNAALKAGGRQELRIWTEPLIRAGEAVDRLRGSYLQSLAESFGAVAERLLGEAVELRYLQGWRAGQGLGEALDRSEGRDRLTGTTQVGPHRADIEVSYGGTAVREIASRGQQKLIAAALVLAQVGEFERRTGRQGTLLIDDPAAELDDVSLQRLLDEVSAVQAQTLVTGLRLAVLAPRENEPVFHVERGSINPVVY